jgi:hypothetical protein
MQTTKEQSTQQPVAIVTGASSGIGLGLTQALLEQGWRVVAVSRSISNSDELKPSSDLVPVSGDVGKKETAVKSVDAALKHFGRIDLLVNNAGIYIPKAFTRRWRNFIRSVEWVRSLTLSMPCSICRKPHSSLAKTFGWMEGSMPAGNNSTVAKSGLHLREPIRRHSGRYAGRNIGIRSQRSVKTRSGKPRARVSSIFFSSGLRIARRRCIVSLLIQPFSQEGKTAVTTG